MVLKKEKVLEYIQNPTEAIAAYDRAQNKNSFEEQFNKHLQVIAMETNKTTIKAGAKMGKDIISFLVATLGIDAAKNGLDAGMSVKEYGKHLANIYKTQKKNLEEINKRTNMNLTTDIPLKKIIEGLL